MKAKLTLSIDSEVIEKAKSKSRELGYSLSKLVENFLSFFAEPYVHCFHCGKKFEVDKSEICLKCGWYMCPHCNGCGCELREDAKKVAYEMKRVYDELLMTDIRFKR